MKKVLFLFAFISFSAGVCSPVSSNTMSKIITAVDVGNYAGIGLVIAAAVMKKKIEPLEKEIAELEEELSATEQGEDYDDLSDLIGEKKQALKKLYTIKRLSYGFGIPLAFGSVINLGLARFGAYGADEDGVQWSEHMKKALGF